VCVQINTSLFDYQGRGLSPVVVPLFSVNACSKLSQRELFVMIDSLGLSPMCVPLFACFQIYKALPEASRVGCVCPKEVNQCSVDQKVILNLKFALISVAMKRMSCV